MKKSEIEARKLYWGSPGQKMAVRWQVKHLWTPESHYQMPRGSRHLWLHTSKANQLKPFLSRAVAKPSQTVATLISKVSVIEIPNHFKLIPGSFPHHFSIVIYCSWDSRSALVDFGVLLIVIALASAWGSVLRHVNVQACAHASYGCYPCDFLHSI